MNEKEQRKNYEPLNWFLDVFCINSPNKQTLRVVCLFYDYIRLHVVLIIQKTRSHSEQSYFFLSYRRTFIQHDLDYNLLKIKGNHKDFLRLPMKLYVVHAIKKDDEDYFIRGKLAFLQQL